MKAEEAKKLADQALDQLTSAISQGKSEALSVPTLGSLDPAELGRAAA